MSAQPVSITRLSALRDSVEALREALRSAFLDLGPRLEMKVYKMLVQFLAVYQSSVAAHETTQPAETAQSVAEGQYIALHYMQDILAACLLLLDERAFTHGSEPARVCLDGFHLLLEAEVDGGEANASPFYVSKSQRASCAQAFFYLCWQAPIPLHIIIQALYPLLGSSPALTAVEVGGASNSEAQEGGCAESRNRIAANVLQHFAPKRRFISQVLNGLILQRRTGVRALLHALLLNDGVTADVCVEASQHIVRLLLTNGSMSNAWVALRRGDEPATAATLELYGGDDGDVASTKGGQRCLTLTLSPVAYYEDQLRLVSQQHLSLFEEQATVPSGEFARETSQHHDREVQPAFLARIGRASKLLPEQTLEERLHLYLALWLNHALHLPPREPDSVAFAEAYKRFFSLNKFFLTPAFGVLALRRPPRRALAGCGNEVPSRDDHCEDNEKASEVMLTQAAAAVRRLHSVVRGGTLGAAPWGAVLVLEAVMPGLLSLTHCMLVTGPAFSPALGHSAVDELATNLYSSWRRLFELDSVFDALGRILARVCAVTNSAEPAQMDMTRGQFIMVRDRVTGPRLEYVEARGLDHGLGGNCLQALFKLMGLTAECRDSPSSDRQDLCAPPALQHAVLVAVVEECAQALASGSGFSTNSADDSDALQDEGSPLSLIGFVEAALLLWPANAIFGSTSPLDVVLSFVSKVAPLSDNCLRWAVRLIPRLTTSATWAPDTPCEAATAPSNRPRRLAHLLQSVQTLSRVLASLQVGAALDTETAALTLSAVAGLQAVEKELNDAQREETLSTNGAADNQHLRLSDDPACVDHRQENTRAAVDRLTRLAVAAAAALDSQSAAMVSVSFVDIANAVEDVALTLVPPFPEAFYECTERVLLVALRCLRITPDTCAAGHAIRCLTWLAMYRLDSIDSSVWSRNVIVALIAKDASGASQPRADPRAAAPLRRSSESAAQLARFKLRLLDVLLGLCDYDTDGRTLRNVDDYCRSPSSGHLQSLYHVLVSLCQPSEASAVQVATLHLAGHYVTHVYPRVSLVQVCALCQEVFRHTRIEMSKAACAAMLASVTEFAVERVDAVADVDLELVLTLAQAMSGYVPPSPGSADDALDRSENAVHAEVVRQHGKRLVSLLSERGADTASRMLVQEL